MFVFVPSSIIAVAKAYYVQMRISVFNCTGASSKTKAFKGRGSNDSKFSILKMSNFGFSKVNKI